MIKTTFYDYSSKPGDKEKQAIVSFLAKHLEQYGDKEEDIAKAFDYAMKEGNTPGGFVLTAQNGDNSELSAAAVINKTGMKGYIPENILVYIATHKEHRGKGIANTMMNNIIEKADGDIALHVEPDNPAVNLYQKFGFTNKYLEMRLAKKGA